MRLISTVILAFLILSPAYADWTLDTENSSLSFVSIKKGKVGEVHHFRHLKGGINAKHQFQLNIGLNSVATNIPIRDERMRKFLFETSRFPVASVAGTLPDGSYEKIQPGDSADASVSVNLQLHGVKKPLSAQLVVVGLGNNRLLVTTRDPVIVNADQFQLTKGIEELRKIAKLPSIASAVPVNFVLVFKRNP